MSNFKLGYARVSTLQQDEGLQQDALQQAGCDRIFVDKASGKLESRPALDELLAQARPGDTLVVWRLDRLGRSLRHLIEVVADMERSEVAFQSLTESIDTSTPAGKLIFHIFASLAQFERELLGERTRRAWRRPGRGAGPEVGRRCGRTPSCEQRRRCVREATTLRPSPACWASAVPRYTGPWLYQSRDPSRETYPDRQRCDSHHA